MSVISVIAVQCNASSALSCDLSTKHSLSIALIYRYLLLLLSLGCLLQLVSTYFLFSIRHPHHSELLEPAVNLSDNLGGHQSHLGHLISEFSYYHYSYANHFDPSCNLSKYIVIIIFYSGCCLRYLFQDDI